MESALTHPSLAVRAGRWWFKYRSLSPLPFLLLMVFLPPQFVPSPLVYSLALIGIFASESLRIWAVGYAGSATRTRGETVPVLVHAGPYRYVRNPLYIANIFLYSLTGVVFGFATLSALLFIYSAVQYKLIVAFEEATLCRLFGDDYETYRGQVPGWFFSLSPRCPSSEHEFNLSKALRSERSTLYSMAAMTVLFVIKKSFF